MNWQAFPQRLGSLVREMPQSVQRPRGAAAPTAGTITGPEAANGGFMP